MKKVMYALNFFFWQMEKVPVNKSTFYLTSLGGGGGGYAMVHIAPVTICSTLRTMVRVN